jgi:hypothetical protein
MSDNEFLDEDTVEDEIVDEVDDTIDDDVQVMTVLPEEDGGTGVVGLAANEVAGMVAGLQAEFAGAAKTGQPAIDAALERLGDLDPTDLASSADVLQDVLGRLESALGSAGEDSADNVESDVDGDDR